MVHRYYDYINYVSGYIEILNYSYIQKQTFNVFFSMTLFIMCNENYIQKNIMFNQQR